MVNRPDSLGPARTCLVTGAGRGIGADIAMRLSGEGHRVAIAARTASDLEALADQLPGPALPVTANVTCQDDIDRLFDTVERTWGPVEILVAAAGAATAAPLRQTTDEQWQLMLDLNLTAPFRCLRRALPPMKTAGWGRAVVIASVAAKRGESQIAAYSASKHGVLGLVRTAAVEYARTGVTVNAVCPGYVDTPMTDESVAAISQRTGRSPDEARQALERRQPSRRLITTGEVTEAVMGCIGNGGINGQGINVDSGAVQS
jgi:NAD(P)-dependent dehydrogenase (short-subunit alcohol dehydrogenase family)